MDLSEYDVSVAAACEVTGVARSTFYRDKKPKERSGRRPRLKHPRALTSEQVEQVALVLNENKYVDRSPKAVKAALLDEGIYLCSERTMYRILHIRGELKERRSQRRHPVHKKPELMAKRPNKVWSWDITNLKGPEKGTVYELYVVMDIYSRFVVGWGVEYTESGELAEDLFSQICTRQMIRRGQLKIHSDRGGPMKSKRVEDLLKDLRVKQSFSRTKVSNDNPFSESHFRHLKYSPNFPARFGCIEDARAFCRSFFVWYNEEHFHEGLNMFTPAMVHGNRIEEFAKRRQNVLDAAYQKFPNRFVKGRPTVKRPPKAVWINPPTKEKGTCSDTACSVNIIGGVQ